MPTVISLVLQASIVATGANTYPVAYEKTNETGQPLVVLVGADWCPACVQMKNNIMPQVEKQGGLAKVNFAYINTDQQNDLAKKLMKGGSIPQLIMFRKTRNGGWLRRQLNGAHSVNETQTFVSKVEEAKAAQPKVVTPKVANPKVAAPKAAQPGSDKLTHR